MKVLFTSQPGFGHVHPMVPLARALQARGHELRWATGPHGCARVEQAGFTALAAGLTTEARHQEFSRRNPDFASVPVPQRRARLFPGLFGDVAAPAMLDDLAEVTARWTPDLVVHDAAEFAGAIVAAGAGVPHVTHAFGALVPRAFVEAAASAVTPLWARAGLAPRPFAGCYDHLYVDICPPRCRPRTWRMFPCASCCAR